MALLAEQTDQSTAALVSVELIVCDDVADTGLLVVGVGPPSDAMSTSSPVTLRTMSGPVTNTRPSGAITTTSVSAGP